MKHGADVAVEFPGLYLVHHNRPGLAHEGHGRRSGLAREAIEYLPFSDKTKLCLARSS